MLTIAPFKGLTYNFHERKDLSTLVAPPYDVISQEEQQAYYQADPHNVIRLILGEKRTGDSDWDNRYTRAADTFQRWQSNRHLIRSPRPCLYLTAMTYDPGNGMAIRTRWGIISLVRIEDEGSEVILPHEKTFSAHKEDRLKLYRACGAQFSQIFGLYDDRENVVLNACRSSADLTPQMDFQLADGTRHRLWMLEDQVLFKQVANAMRSKAIFIADGHHRYETSRNYRNLMRARHGRKPADKSYEFVLMYLSNMRDEGLTILPSHRMVKRVPGFQEAAFFEKAEKYFDIKTFPISSNGMINQYETYKDSLQEAGLNGTSFAFFCHGSDWWYMLSLKEGAHEQMGDALHSSLKNLDVVVLSRLVFQKCLGFTKEGLDDDEVFHYQSNTPQALSSVASGEYQMMFMLNATKIEQVTEVAENGLVMPRKSTYFYPKVLTGLVFNKIDPKEIISVPRDHSGA
ncbi:MAG: hypothetical protein B6240_11405 [Desulfobacteraceae bacterium 4572_87]|nr:MAG: hypothetical protein B6240_11405 [Desulfobacteraceae bacterium 4572_87]